MTLGSFALDKFEVTVGRFRNFVGAYADGWRPAVGSGANPNVTVGDTSWQAGWDDSASAGTNLPPTGANATATRANFVNRLTGDPYNPTWTDAPGANENKAINWVDWYEAFAFCIWDGGRLPAEAEWEYAAAGGDQNRFYPWGCVRPDCTYANFWNGSYSSPCHDYGDSVAAVGSTPNGNGRWGHADLAGNVDEWCLDWYAPYATASMVQNNIPFGTARVVRGGMFSTSIDYLRAANRGYFSPTFRGVGLGLRCARTP
jgi:formylglycine-generating enzyme required for sulfatase activity